MYAVLYANTQVGVSQIVHPFFSESISCFKVWFVYNNYLMYLIDVQDDGSDDPNNNRMNRNRLSVLLNSALGVVARTSDAFIDLDTLPQGR